MPEASFDADVVVIGGGPAGSTAAALLASAGRRVILLEKERFPRFHIGESLLPFNMDLFRRLGIQDRLAGHFVEKRGAVVASSDAQVSRYILFSEGLEPGYPGAYQVRRAEFDAILLANAAARGADVREGAAVIEASASHREGCQVVFRDGARGSRRVRGRFLLDASGQDAFIASRRGLRRASRRLRKVSLFAHYEGVGRPYSHHEGDLVIIVLRDGWFWMIPLGGSLTSFGLVTDADRLKSSGLRPEEFLQEAARCCPAVRRCLATARRVSAVRTARDFSYRCADVAGDGYLLLGDAAAFIDPVFSTGVWLAMSSAETAADLLHAALGRPGAPADLSPRVFRPYRRRVTRSLRRYTGLVERFYRPGFMDVFLNPTERFGLKGAVITLLAGCSHPKLSLRLRLGLFYAVLRAQRHLNLVPPVPLMSTLEPEATGQGAGEAA